MKLINKTILYYSLVSIPLLAVAATFSYFLVKSELQDGVDENLEREKLNAMTLIESLKEPASNYLTYDSLSFIKVIAGEATPKDMYSDTNIYNKREREYQGYRVLRSGYRFNHTNYAITVSRTTVEEKELMESLLWAFLLIIGFLVLSFFTVSWLLSRQLWKPFYKTLSMLGRYDLKNHEAAHFGPETTTEFNQLNAELNKMTEKMRKDFIRQKEFTENASHEMQTPLAVVRANLSLLMQSPNMREAEMNQLEGIENTIRKLTSLNKTLLLLAKIENNQYPESSPFDLREKIGASLELYAYFIQAKSLKVTTDIRKGPAVNMNPALAEIMINNLVQNAIRHNDEKGTIKIDVSERSFSISNTGAPLTIPEEELFERFKKNDGSKESLGLGLAIVKSIADRYGIEIHYSYNNRLHCFTLRF